LVKLQLQSNRLTGPISYAFASLVNIDYLDLSDNYFDGDVPPFYLCCPPPNDPKYNATQTCKCSIDSNAFGGCPLPLQTQECCSVVHSCDHEIPLPPAFPKLSAAGSATVVGGSIGAGGVLALLPALSHGLHAFASGLLFQGQVLGMLGQLNVGWAGSFSGLQGVLSMFNFQVRSLLAAAAFGALARSARGPLTPLPSAPFRSAALRDHSAQCRRLRAPFSSRA